MTIKSVARAPVTHQQVSRAPGMRRPRPLPPAPRSSKPTYQRADGSLGSYPAEQFYARQRATKAT